MTRLSRVLVAIAFLTPALPSLAEPLAYKIDPSHSSAQFSVRHMMISDVKGAFTKVSGEIEYDAKNPKDSKVDATIEMASVDTHDENRDKHLRGADFFDVEKFPTMVFKSKKVTPEGKDKLKVLGDLTLHGVTKEVTLTVDGPTAEIKDQKGGGRRGAAATGQINRKDFNIIWNKAMDGGGVAVGDEINITIDVEMTKPKA